MASPLFRLTYFPIAHGRGLPLRIAAVLNGVEWEDHLIKKDAFTQLKTSPSSGYQARWTGLPEATFYNQPNPSTVAQSASILRYIAQLRSPDTPYNLYPTETPFECCRIDEIVDSVEDMLKIIVPVFYEKDAEKKKELEVDLTDNPDKLPLWLGRYERRLEENWNSGNRNGFFIGKGVTIADLKVFSVVCIFHPECRQFFGLNLDGIRGDLIAEFPRINEHCNRFLWHPAIRAFVVALKGKIAYFTKNEQSEMTVRYVGGQEYVNAYVGQKVQCDDGSEGMVTQVTEDKICIKSIDEIDDKMMSFRWIERAQVPVGTVFI